MRLYRELRRLLPFSARLLSAVVVFFYMLYPRRAVCSLFELGRFVTASEFVGALAGDVADDVAGYSFVSGFGNIATDGIFWCFK